MRVILRVCVLAGIDRHQDDVTVAHAPFGDDMVGERLHLGTAPLQHGHFEATVVADVNMERCLSKVVVVVEFLRQALGKLAGRMIVDIAQGRDAIAPARALKV